MSTNTLTKTAAARQKAADPFSLAAALKNGGPLVWASCLVMGLANILNGQIDNGGDPTPTPEPQQGGNDNPPSGAISLIGFAVAAVVAGAVIVRKKHN